MKREPGSKERLEDQYAQIATGAQADGEKRANHIELLKSMGYSEQEIASVPDACAMGLGCGNPTALAGLKQGETVLDLGSGIGLDALLAAQKVGPEGKVIGVDMTAEMVNKAREAACDDRYENVRFMLGHLEALPVGEESVDVAISNCVISHCLDKVAVFKEVFRALRPNGRIHISDLVAEGELPPADTPGLCPWAEWLPTASGKQEYLDAIAKAGFREVTVVSECPFSLPDMPETLAGRVTSIHVRAYKQSHCEGIDQRC